MEEKNNIKDNDDIIESLETENKEINDEEIIEIDDTEIDKVKLVKRNNNSVWKKIFLIILLIFGLFLFLTTVPVKKEYYCEQSYRMENNRCIKEEFVEANYNVTYSCNNVYPNERLVGNTCVYEIYTLPRTTVSCPTYYREYGGRCKFNFGEISSSCPSGKLLWGIFCYDEYVEASYSKYCITGELVGNQCLNTHSYLALANYEYYCDYGYELFETLCVREVWKNPKINYLPILY